MDQLNQWIAGYALAILESYSPPSGQCAGDTVATGGGFGDTVTDCFYFCSATCKSGGSCSVSSTQTITVNGFPIATENVNWTCSATKRNEYFARRGLAPGSPGANMTGNMDPQIHMDLQNMTVREILNGVALYSLRLNQQTPPDSTGNKIPPTSWVYEFIIDPSAPTGLGGTPHWKAL